MNKKQARKRKHKRETKGEPDILNSEIIGRAETVLPYVEKREKIRDQEKIN